MARAGVLFMADFLTLMVRRLSGGRFNLRLGPGRDRRAIARRAAPTEARRHVVRTRPLFFAAKCRRRQLTSTRNLLGQIGAFDVGGLHVRTAEDDDRALPGEDFSVVRLQS